VRHSRYRCLPRSTQYTLLISETPQV